MEKEEVKEELKKFIHPDDEIYFHMMATKAYHQLGEISREKPDLCVIINETPNFYVGNWSEGYGFFHVLFPKETTRDLTDEEFEKFEGTPMGINNQMAYSLNIVRRMDDPKKEIKVKLIKLDESNPNRHNINVGYSVEGTTNVRPRVDKCFFIYHDDTKLFNTSPVVEIINDNKFRTRNSTYYWEELK